MIKLSTLYKKTSTGRIQYWTISAYAQAGQMNDEEYCPEWGCIETRYGQVDGKEQITYDIITEGKNPGKKNSTTAYEQAVKEAKAKHDKQLKKGYVITIDDASNDRIDDLIEGGILPMLAHKFSQHAHKVKYPCYAQPKLDGIRCIAIIKDGVCTLWSRTRKRINSMPHIELELSAIFEGMDIILDGELYNHDFKHNFEHIVSMVRQDEPDPNHMIVQYHVYDIITNLTFENRLTRMQECFSFLEENPFSSLRLVETTMIKDEDSVMPLFDKYKEEGFEGLMLRNGDSDYVNKRSFDLQKVKNFDDAEYKIIGVKEGRGKLAGHAIFVCVDEKGDDFEAKMKGETSKLKEYFDNHSLWQGKSLTVQYHGLTNARKVPRWPVGVAIRDYE